MLACCRFNTVFKELGSTDEGQMCILKSMYDLWSDHQQMVVVLINKMMKTNLLKVSAVANWIFSEEMIRDFTRCVMLLPAYFSRDFVWSNLNVYGRKICSLLFLSVFL